MRLLTAISIASLVVSIAAVVFVLGLYAELEKSEPETPKEHTQELTETMVARVIEDHVAGLIKSAGITEDNVDEKIETLKALPGYWCFWHDRPYIPIPSARPIPPPLLPPLTGTRPVLQTHKQETLTYSNYPLVMEPHDWLTYNYVKEYDVWLATSYVRACEKLTTWAIDDNTGEVTYGHPDEK